jgi:hypothetical protein
VLPGVHLHVCNWHSRSSRPPLPLPADQREGVESVTLIGDTDEYAGWVRCGYYERQLLMSETNTSSGERVLTVMAGLEFPVGQGVFDHTEIPLAIGNAEDWWAHYELIPEQPDGFVGCAVGIDLVDDWMGKSTVLALQPSIAARLGLRSPASWQQQLVLTDTSGAIAIVFRSWNVRQIGGSIDKESPMLEGCDLLMHPNLFGQMQRLGAHSPSIVRWIRRAQ